MNSGATYWVMQPCVCLLLLLLSSGPLILSIRFPAKLQALLSHKQLCRCVLLIHLVICRGGVFIIEQPGGSWLQYHPRIRWLSRSIKACCSLCFNMLFVFFGICFWIGSVCSWYLADLLFGWCAQCVSIPSVLQSLLVYKSAWWMWHYGAKTPKRHYALSNSKGIASLNRGTLTGWSAAMDPENKTTRRYVDTAGRKRFVGTKHLKKTG